MPELPEVETTRCGIEPHIAGQIIDEIIVRQPRLRWPVPANLNEFLAGKAINAVERRAKYLLLRIGQGALIIHLGMSGSLRVVSVDTPPEKHDHVDLLLGSRILRLRDPRRFGAVLWAEREPLNHTLLRELGPEPLSEAFDGDYLHRLSRGRKSAVKTFIMNGKVVVGVGNIYANEALFLAGIHPKRAAGKIGLERYRKLADAIKAVLAEAIRQGGTTLRDFVQEDGRPGYFAQQLNVYGRGGRPCPKCHEPIREVRVGQRSAFYCGWCQR